MDREALKNLKQLWYNDVLWPNFIKFLEKEHDKALAENKHSTNERALGRLYFIKELMNLQKYGREMFKDEL